MSWTTLCVFWTMVGVGIYTHVAYPLLMVLCSSALRPRKRTAAVAAKETASVTLIIPAYNEEAVLEAKLENALKLDYPKKLLEIIVASDGSRDRTVDIARKYENLGVTLLAFGQRRGKASVLNDAVPQAGGEIVCLCDANVIFRPDALRRLLEPLADPGIGAVTGDVRLASYESNFGVGESLYYRLERAIQLGESRIGSIMCVDGGMYALRRELFRPLRPDTILDDFVTAMRVIQQGKRVVYQPAAVANENGTPLARDEFARRVRVTAGAAQALKRGDRPPIRRPVELWEFVSHKLLRWLGPIWLTALFASSVMLWNAGVIYRAALAAQVVFCGLAVVATISTRFRKTRVGGIAFYFVMSHVAMAAGLIKGLLNRQRVAWNRTKRTGTCDDARPTTSD